jgi:pimeloyl-ACP methyl ester carboxylesterase
MPEVTLPQGTVRYREQGPPDGPAVLFVHGFLVNGSLWDDAADALAARGFRTLQPDLPLGSHAIALNPDADLSPRGVARLIAAFAEAVGIDDATLVGNDTGGALCQFLLDTDPSRIGRVVLTNCDGLTTFPPKPFGLILGAARHPSLFRLAMLPTRIAAVRHSPLAFGLLVRRKLDPARSAGWVEPYLRDAGIRRDAAKLCRAVKPAELADVATRLRHFDGPALFCWAPRDRFFTIDLGRRLAACFADARVVEIADSATFVPLDQPLRLADEIAAFAAVPAAAAAD